MTTWSDETLPSTAWGPDFLLINATDILLIGASATDFIVLADTTTPL
jgi:hypothetical protein